MEFAREFPAMMKDGRPRSWREFVYGLTHLSRVAARDSIKLASATRIAGAELKEYLPWHKTQTYVAGWK